jgi:hypothetical protein
VLERERLLETRPHTSSLRER